MRVVVEVGDWEHDCCGPAYEQDAVVTLTCLVVQRDRDRAPRYVETHHELDTRWPTIEVHGRVADLQVRHPDGTDEAIARIPGGRALRGFDEQDDGHLETPWTGEPVANDSGTFLLTIET